MSYWLPGYIACFSSRLAIAVQAISRCVSFCHNLNNCTHCSLIRFLCRRCAVRLRQTPFGCRQHVLSSSCPHMSLRLPYRFLLLSYKMRSRVFKKWICPDIRQVRCMRRDYLQSRSCSCSSVIHCTEASTLGLWHWEVEAVSAVQSTKRAFP